MLKIRLSRTGKKAQPSFRVVVQEHTSAVKGKFIEVLGYYRPADNPKAFEVKKERVEYWISVGAKPSDSLAMLLKKSGMEGMEKYLEPRNKQRKKKKEVEVKETPAPAAAPVEKAPEAPAEVEEEKTTEDKTSE